MVKEKNGNNKSRFFAYYYKYEFEELLKKHKFKIIKSIIESDEGGRKNIKWMCVWGRKPK